MRRDDVYPSRVGGDALVIPRKDPVVYAQGRAKPRTPLSQQQLASFEDVGALAFDAILPEREIDPIARRAMELQDEAFESRDSGDEIVREPGGDAVRSIFAVHESDALIARFVADERIFGLAEQILGSPVYVHQSRINYKPAFAGKEFFWHSDFETWHVEDGMPRMRACSLSINLTRNRPDNGPLLFIPGSHRQFVSCPGRTPEKNYERSLRRQEIGVPPPQILETLAAHTGIETPTGPVGSALLFDSNLMHGSNGNITPYPRTNLFLVFNSVENPLGAPFSGRPARPGYIAERHPSVLG